MTIYISIMKFVMENYHKFPIFFMTDGEISKITIAYVLVGRKIIFIEPMLWVNTCERVKDRKNGKSFMDIKDRYDKQQR